MRQLIKYNLFLASLFTFIIIGFAQQPVSNPLLIHSNKPIRFDKVNEAIIHEAAATIIIETGSRIKKIAAIPAKERTWANTLKLYDNLLYQLNDVNAAIGLFFWFIQIIASKMQLQLKKIK